MKMKKSFKRPLAFVLAFALLATAIGIGAYLTDSDVKKDVYTVGNVQAEIVSNGDMELDNVGALLPGTVHAYERAAMNTGINDAYVFMSLTIPYEMVGVSDDDGTQIGERVRQLFIPGHADGFIGSEWKLVDVGYIGQYDIEDNGQYCGEHDQYSAVVGDTITYVYGFIGDNADGSLKALASGETTSNLVETMELTNLYNASKITGEVSTKLYAIQSANVNGGLTDVNGVWAVINKAITGAENTAASTLTYNLTNNKSGEVVGYAPLRLIDENGNVVATSVANENGNGQFQNVPAGNYSIETAVGDLAVQGGATGYAMRNVAANVTLVGEDQTVNLTLTTPSTTLIKGREFNTLIPDTVTSIVFTTIGDKKLPGNEFDVSADQDGSVMAWVDGTTMYVASMNNGVIYANYDSQQMFRGKTNLTSIDASNLDCSGAYNVQLMFYSCTGLSNVNIDAFDFDNFTTGASMFTNCGWLTEIVLPETLTSIDKYMFNNCQNLTSVVLPDGLTHIGFGAFQNCKSLTTITIPASVTVIEDQAFYGSGLTSVKFEGEQSQISFGNNWNYNTPMNPIVHKCESVCKTCKGCTDDKCTEAACATKCKCGVVTTGTIAFSITDNLTEEQTGSQTFSHYLVWLTRDNTVYYEVSVLPGETVLMTDVEPGTYNVEAYPVVPGSEYPWGNSDLSWVDVKSITVKAGTQSCNINLGEVVVQNGYAQLSVTDYNTWGQTVSAYEFVIDGKTYTVKPGKTSRATLPAGTYKDVVVYAVFADGSKSTSIQDKNTFTIQADKTVTFKVTLGEIPNFDWTIGVNDLLTWDGKTVDRYEISIDNGKEIVTVSPAEGSTISEKKAVSVKAGSHSVAVTVYFTDGTSVDARSYQSGSNFNITKVMTSTIMLGYKVNVAVVDNYAWGTAPTSYKVSFAGKNLTVQSGKNGSTLVAPGTYDVVVYAVMADKSEVELVADVATLVVDASGKTYTITVNGPVGAGNEPEVPETPDTPEMSGNNITIAINDTGVWKETPSSYIINLGNKEYSAELKYGEESVVFENIPDGTYEIAIYVYFADGTSTSTVPGPDTITVKEGYTNFTISIK